MDVCHLSIKTLVVVWKVLNAIATRDRVRPLDGIRDKPAVCSEVSVEGFLLVHARAPVVVDEVGLVRDEREVEGSRLEDKRDGEGILSKNFSEL